MQRSRRALWILVGSVLTAATWSCGGAGEHVVGASTTAPPQTPIVPAKPLVVLSSDSITARAVFGADVLQYTVGITAGDTTTVRGLAVGVTNLGDGDSGAWIAAQLDTTIAPAKLTIRIDPRTASVGVRTATVSITATGAEAKSLRAQLTVLPHPALIVDSASRALTAMLGDSLPALAIAVRSSSDTISKLSVGAPDCGTHAWMSAHLSRDATPAVIMLALDPTGLVAGTYSCRVDVRSSQALVDSASHTLVVSLTLRQAPRIAVDLATVNASITSGSDAPAAHVQITNGGSGTLDGLSVGSIDYGNGPSGWLTATLDRSVAPATITLVPSARSLGAGTVTANIPIQSTADGVIATPVMIAVSFVVAPRPFRLVITPAGATISYNITTQQSVSAVISILDGNGSGQSASIAQFSAKIPTNVPCPVFTRSGPVGPAKVPLSILFAVSPFATGGVPVPGSCTIVYTVTLDNGQVGSFSMTVSISP